ncbi:MAG: hypothetical protein Unbinned2716contig1004_34 [Prokaryotic dsDNA virus sp.]|nr:MAG: hypothetical protein Unbinned2716contig1004_34 [Prokaryotic dsDNA virus sp.]|tara:strand:- start:6513 stop:7298 length:786 start_codon:yes stop_codon:yes gene_type:complete
MSFTNKSIATSYGDILQTDNNGSGRTASGTVIKDGLGQSTALTLGSDKIKVKPASDSTTAVVVENAAGTDILVVDATNTSIKAGTTQSYVNTQIKEFGVFDMSPTADTHHPMVAMNAMYSSGASALATMTDFGTGTDPATTFAFSSGAEHIVPLYWYVPTAITIDEVRVIASTDAADTLNFHLYSYAMGTGTGVGAGDLGDGTLLAHNGSSLTTGDDRITTTTLTIDSANTTADRVILAFVENVGDTNDITAQLIVKYHYQ